MKITVKLDAIGTGYTLLDGVDVSRFVKSVKFNANAGETPTVHLELLADEIDVEATDPVIKTLLFSEQK